MRSSRPHHNCNPLTNFLFQLEPGDRILAVNGEDVKDAPRDHVIQLVRSCDTQVNLLVCQPAMSSCSGRKSTLLSAGKRAKLRSRPSRVRFAESVCVNGAPLFPVSIIITSGTILNSTPIISNSNQRPPSRGFELNRVWQKP